jgi:hypothetical protein
MFNHKGQIRIIEAFLAITVVFSALIIAGITYPSSPDLSKPKSLASIGMRALIKLDTNGTLGKFISQQNWTALKSALDILLPTGVSFNLTVYDENLNQINGQLIQNTNVLGRETVSVQYACASQSRNVQFWILRLQLSWTR